MTPRHGRAPKGQRITDPVPDGRWMTTTFLAALRCDRITAPCDFDGPVDGGAFEGWVEQELAPTFENGDVVILDNLASHENADARKAVERKRAKLEFLPP